MQATDRQTTSTAAAAFIVRTECVFANFAKPLRPSRSKSLTAAIAEIGCKARREIGPSVKMHAPQIGCLGHGVPRPGTARHPPKPPHPQNILSSRCVR